MTRKRIAILGSTGSIGTNTLDLVRRFPDRFEVVALAAGQNTGLMAEQVREFKPALISMASEENASKLIGELGSVSPKIVHGVNGAVDVATYPDADIVVSAFVGAAGLVPTYEALKLGRWVALANKETLVMAGALMMRAAKESGARIFPVDSEHSAIFQCLQGQRQEDVDHLILTASGGPFFSADRDRLAGVTVDEALAHPVWKMGPKVTIDSSTLMNKGLEVIEARWLFDMEPDRIRIVVHPQCRIHSMVALKDGSIIAQVGESDMRGPIAYALSYPERLELPFLHMDPAKNGIWEFHEPDTDLFKCIDLAYEALRLGPGYPAVLNAANEISVDAFLKRKLPYLGIAEANSRVLEAAAKDGLGDSADTVENVLEIDCESRRRAEKAVGELAQG